MGASTERDATGDVDVEDETFLPEDDDGLSPSDEGSNISPAVRALMKQ